MRKENKHSETSGKARINWPGVSWPRRLQTRRSLFLAIALLAAIVAWAGAFLLAQRDNGQAVYAEQVRPSGKVKPEEQAHSENSGFRQAVANTDAERELEKMLRGKDEDIDLALANWLIASDIPEFHDLTRQAFFAQLGAMTEQVREDMVRMQVSGYGGTDSDDPETRCQRFCSAIIGLRFAYAEAFREENLAPSQMKALYADADNISLAGLLRTRRGTCVSMPLIYLVIGQRLGVPVHLVALGKHFFIRWEEPGFRMNIETTSVNKIAWTPDDSVYMNIEGMTRDQVHGSDLRNLSNREVVGELLFTRMSYWYTKNGRCEPQSARDLAGAHCFAPDDPIIEKTYQAAFDHNRIKPEYTLVDVKPKE